MNYEIGNPNLIWLMLSIPIFFVLLIYSGWAKRRALASFGSTSKPGKLIGESLAGLLLMLGMALLVLACMDIRWGKTSREVPQKGLEVVFALDVSRSMLAQDVKPNRLARAKQQINDMVDEMAGDRIGLVAFAGEATQAVPLTNHYSDFRQKLESLGPDTVSRGGSQLGIAIAEAADAFISKTNDHKTIILFTDGEDQESGPIELAKELHAKNGTRVFTVGLGDFDQGARIPDGTTRRSEYLQHEGQQVWSKLNGSILREIATETKAAYIPAGTKRVNMADVYHSYIANVEKSEFETARINAFVPRFQWFALPAFACLFLNVWLTTRSSSAMQRSRQAARVSKTNRTKAGTGAKVASRAAAVLIALMPAALSAQTANESAASSINAANQLLRENKLQEAIETLNQVDDSPNAKYRDELNYSLATAHFRSANIDSAVTLFEQSAKSTNTQVASDSRYNLGNCHYAKALPLVDQQPDDAISELETAITHYRSALRLDRVRSDARENLERAGKLIKQLKNQQENNQQQEQPQEQNSNEDQKQDQDQQDDSESESQQNENQDEQNQSEQQQQNSEDSQSDQNQQSDSDSDDKQENSSKGQNEESENSDSSQQAEDGQDESTDPNSQQQSQSTKDSQQEKDGDAQSQKNGEQAEGEQPPEGDLSAANESKAETKDPSSANQAAARVGSDESGLMTKQEALKLLQAVRDRDMIRRLKQQQQQRRRRVRVDKDW